MENHSDPSLDDLSVFLAVCEAAGFRAAAKRLGRSASNVSDTITRVEAQLGVPLLTRTTRSVMPTEAGRELAARISPLLAETRAAIHDVASPGQAVRGLLKLNVTGAVMVDILPPLIDRFLVRHPLVRVEIVVEDRFVDAIADGCVAGIRYGEHLAQDMIAVPIGPKFQQLALAAAPSYLSARGHPSHPGEISSHECIRMRRRGGNGSRGRGCTSRAGSCPVRCGRSSISCPKNASRKTNGRCLVRACAEARSAVVVVRHPEQPVQAAPAYRREGCALHWCSTPKRRIMIDIGKAGTFTIGTRSVKRIGYGAMQLAGPGVFGPPEDRAGAVAVLRAAIESGVDHIDTSDFYGPHVTNQVIREALHPYRDDLVIVTKIGALRGADGAWIPALSPEALTQAVHDNLRNLGLDVLEVVNLRSMLGTHGPAEGSLEAPLAALAELQQRGLVRHIGLSNVTPTQVADGRRICAVACVQNLYNLAHRDDEALIDDLARHGTAYVPFFPLGGFTPLQSTALSEVANALGATPMQVALAWLLHRAPNILLIPGTSSVAHLRENLAAADLTLTGDAVATLDGIAAAPEAPSPRSGGNVARSV